MTNFIKKIFLFTFSIILTVVSISYSIDPANLFHTDLVEIMAENLENNYIIYMSGNIDEGKFIEARLKGMKEQPETIIIGSSHVMYQPWEFESYFVAGLSGAYLGDYYGVVGLLEQYRKQPRKIIIGVDPWSFMRGAQDGRHISLKKISENIYCKIYNIGNNDTDTGAAQVDKYKELFTVSYFQESMHLLLKRGPKYYFFYRNRIEKADNEDIEDVSKITPRGRHIFSTKDFYGSNYNNMTCSKMINNKSIYQLGAGYIDLPMDNLKEFEELIDYLQKHNIELEIYMHPWYPMLYEHFKSNHNYGGVIRLEEYIRYIAKKNNIVVHGSYDYKKCNVNEEDFADYLHLKADKMLESYNVVL